MGYLRFVLKKGLVYFSVLFATITILYVFTYPILQQALLNSVNTAVQEYQSYLITHSKGLNAEQIKESVEKYRNDLYDAYGLNKPILAQYWIQLWNLLKFDFGVSYFLTSPTGSNKVVDIIAYYLPNTILLFTTGTILVILGGTLIGLLAARYSGSIWDKILPPIAVFHSAIPTWWLGFVLIAALSYGVHIFPPGGMNSVPPPSQPIQYGLDVLYHLSLPLITFFIVNVGGFAYVVRGLVLSVMKEDFVITAKARGLPERRIIYRHVLRSASPPIATQAILAIAGSFGGGIVTEVVFQWPGVGLLTFYAVQQQDLPIILAITYILTIILLLGLFIGELIYGLLDPRIKVSE
jgi:peptide/nickel transport system permease protein